MVVHVEKKMKSNNSLKKILNLTIFIICASIVAKETYVCLTKYLSQPQGTHISVDQGIGHVFPQFTICPSVNYAKTKIFKECGLEWTKFYFGEINETRSQCLKIAQKVSFVNICELLLSSK